MGKFTGVIPDIPDPRDFFVTAAAQAYPLPIVMKQTRVLDQGMAGRCNTKTDQSGMEAVFDKKMSDNLVYADCMIPPSGSSPRTSAQYIIDVGMPSDADDPCNTMDYPEVQAYVSPRRTNLLKSAAKHKMGSYAFLHTVAEIKAVMWEAQELTRKGKPAPYIKFMMGYDGSHPDKFGFWDLDNINPSCYHEVYLQAVEMHQCARGVLELPKVKNSWGPEWGNGKSGTIGDSNWNGNGFFWTTWEGVLKYDAVIAVWPLPEAEPKPEPQPDPVHAPLRLKDPFMTDADTNGDVSWVQQRLVVHGYKVTVDGKYGPLTEKAVKAFQLAKGLTVDGVVGPKTWAALKKDPDQVNPQPDPDPDIEAALRADFRAHLYGALCGIYCWGGAGENTITESIIHTKETSSSNAKRVITFWRAQQAAGVTKIRMWDCSGLISRWLIDHAIITKRTDCDGLWRLCEPVELSALQPLDLVFRGDPKDFRHVGVYMGDGLVIEAQGRDKGVVIRGIYASGKTYWTYAGRLSCLK